ncbi:hypothetical protein ACFYN3_40890, partial [Streptomyces lavendulae]|uniref:hypothetical protein n=1 Tax=Streptomyces lavendulae TaxID=1914 RepID=UPI003681B38F
SAWTCPSSSPDRDQYHDRAITNEEKSDLTTTENPTNQSMGVGDLREAVRYTPFDHRSRILALADYRSVSVRSSRETLSPWASSTIARSKPVICWP